jgi:5-oxopent-3-ene-1,2,5-tricarboxylate decarboxylase/2-hydroxyhepta-2,4-diene-1,7-dioate isomerase
MVYGVALNFKAALAVLGDAVYRDPYKEPPVAPILYMKPANTWISAGAPIPCPRGVPQLRMGGTLGVVIGGGFRIVNDVSIPHASYFRPAIREQCRDGFCSLGPVVDGARLANPDSAEIRIFVNGELRALNSTRNLVRNVAKLIADINEFMTLHAGDVLLVGEPDNAPLAGIGDRVRVEIEGLGALENPVEAEP